MKEYEIIIRLILAIAVGGLIGYERSYKNRPAGFRTHILVCVGAAIISLIQLEIVNHTNALLISNPDLIHVLKVDIGRMGAQVITGVGFLGAGTIIREKGLVKGLTTAASVWAVACIGLAIGLGMYFISIISTASVFIALVILKKVEERFIDKSYMFDLEMSYKAETDFIKNLQKYLRVKNIRVQNICIDDKESKRELTKSQKIVYTVIAPKYIDKTRIIQDISQTKGMIKIKAL